MLIRTAPETTIPSLAIAGRRHGRIDAWTFYAVAVSIVLAVPVLVVAGSLLAPFGPTWRHLAATVLPSYVENSLWLMLGVGAGVTVIGVATAWLVTMTRFPGARQFEWLLVLPLAMPAYVIAYTYTGLMDFAGPVQSTLRELTGWGARDYWFPQVRSFGGAVADADARLLSLCLPAGARRLPRPVGLRDRSQPHARAHAVAELPARVPAAGAAGDHRRRGAGADGDARRFRHGAVFRRATRSRPASTAPGSAWASR